MSEIPKPFFSFWRLCLRRFEERRYTPNTAIVFGRYWAWSLPTWPSIRKPMIEGHSVGGTTDWAFRSHCLMVGKLQILWRGRRDPRERVYDLMSDEFVDVREKPRATTWKEVVW